MGTNQDQYYIDQVIKGNTKAYTILINRYKNMIFTLALKIVGNREEAEEIGQDVFLKAYHSLKTFKGEAKFSTWLYKIGYNKSLDYVKKKERALPTIDIEVSDVYYLQAVDSIFNYFEQKDQKEFVRKALDSLSVKDQVLITLFYFEELSLKEISEIKGIRPEVVKVRLYRSRKKLAEALKALVEPEIISNYGGQG